LHLTGPVFGFKMSLYPTGGYSYTTLYHFIPLYAKTIFLKAGFVKGNISILRGQKAHKTRLFNGRCAHRKNITKGKTGANAITRFFQAASGKSGRLVEAEEKF
jgi:hypothetical protein